MRSLLNFLFSSLYQEPVGGGFIHPQDYPDKDSPMSFQVYVAIYDVGHSLFMKSFNDLARQLHTGVYHVSIIVNGFEYAYGARAHGSGVSKCRSSDESDQHRYRESLFMGWIRMGPNDLDSFFNNMRAQWQGDRYDTLRNNCCHFVSDALRRLELAELPGWVTAMAETGAVVGDLAQQQVETSRSTVRKLWKSFDAYFKISEATSPQQEVGRTAPVARTDKAKSKPRGDSNKMDAKKEKLVYSREVYAAIVADLNNPIYDPKVSWGMWIGDRVLRIVHGAWF